MNIFQKTTILALGAKCLLTALKYWRLPYGLIGRVPGYRSRGPVSIPGATTFSEK
jgi:hypothetical protein